MNQEIKQKWIDALLSGKYKQGRGLLRQNDDEYCCLGVLCDLHAQETGGEWALDLMDGTYMYDRSRTCLPPDVARWAGIAVNEYTVRVEIEGRGSSLTVLNDRSPPLDSSFEYIASIIEAQL